MKNSEEIYNYHGGFEQVPEPAGGGQFDIEISKVNNLTTYKVNGREYGSYEELPPEVKQIISKVEKNPQIKDGFIVDSATTYEINGKEYKSLDEVPSELRGMIAGMEAYAGKGSVNIEHITDERGERYIVNGKEYEDLDDVPAEMRKLFKEMEKRRADIPLKVKHEEISRVQRTSTVRKNYRFIDGLPAGVQSSFSSYGPDYSDAYRMSHETQRNIVKTMGYIATGISYALLIAWSHLMPASVWSYLFLSFLIGDIASKVVFGFWGFTEEVIKADLKGFGMQLVGLGFFIALLFREGAFEGPLDTRGEAIALVAILAAVVMFIKLAGLALKRMVNL